ncbi:AAA family ATPase [Spirulina sp. 06S082]|uniref:AAA family ATPase n=1 Tax=Spirulina sp. 06S082 TaxID=3110248 RepID=UPI002B1F4676|nr:AAA family ATPase [Spirulina sp. 06S082]MEA5471629.1 AAA family ATPase [Spirulina sp. 06S082]
MIREVKIQNYKSIESLDLELGRINVLIGENGCGKTNILEAIALASAAYSDKLDNEFLVSRGIRVTQPQFMRSAFDKENVEKYVGVEIILNDFKKFPFALTHENKLYDQWEQINPQKVYGNGLKMLDKSNERIKELDEIEKDIQKNKNDLQNKIRNIVQFKNDILEQRILLEKSLNDLNEEYKDELNNFNRLSFFSEFLVFCPNNSSLRIFEQEGQIQPLGIHGEGLFKFLRFLDMKEDKTRFNEIKERLRLISWFKDFEIPKDLFENERRIHIFDRYLDPELKYFDQRSSNEGFLFTLFYLALFVGEETPDFFAIDNIDNSLNPRLCRRLLQELVELAQKYDKQTILTTHNPAVLDGLDLDDDEQRLFVVYRNKFGYTKVRRVSKPKAIAGQKPVRLSEAFLRGYIGGLPKNF